MIHIRGLTILLAVSYLSHAVLLVHNAENEAVRTQQGVGQLLAEQMAESAGPLVQNRDTVGLGLMMDRIGQSKDILSARVLSTGNLTLAGRTAPQSAAGIRYTSPIRMDDQSVGTAEIMLAAPARGELMRSSGPGLLVSLILHGLLFAWVRWPAFFARARVPILQPLPALRKQPVTPVQTAAETELPSAPPASTMLLQIVLDDEKGLLQRVNASTADQLLVILEKLLHRAAKLHQGHIVHPFGPEGALARFDGDSAEETSARALACAKLYLALADAAYQQRRAAKLFALPVKLAVRELRDREEDGTAFDAVMQLARRGERQDLLLDAARDTLIRLLNRHTLESLAPRKVIPEASLASTGEVDSPQNADAATANEQPGELSIADAAIPASQVQTTEEAVAGDADLPSQLLDDDGLQGPWRVKALSAEDEAVIQEQRRQILERKKAPVSEHA